MINIVAACNQIGHIYVCTTGGHSNYVQQEERTRCFTPLSLSGPSFALRFFFFKQRAFSKTNNYTYLPLNAIACFFNFIPTFYIFTSNVRISFKKNYITILSIKHIHIKSLPNILASLNPYFYSSLRFLSILLSERILAQQTVTNIISYLPPFLTPVMVVLYNQEIYEPSPR